MTDVFTREVATKALPDKRAETVTRAAAEIIPDLVQEESNYVVTTDMGNEFRGRLQPWQGNPTDSRLHLTPKENQFATERWGVFALGRVHPGRANIRRRTAPVVSMAAERLLAMPVVPCFGNRHNRRSHVVDHRGQYPCNIPALLAKLLGKLRRMVPSVFAVVLIGPRCMPFACVRCLSFNAT